MMLTPFGVAIRKLRLDKSLRLLDLSQKMDRTAAFVSAVETGRKQIPAGYVDEVAKALELTAKEKERLQRAADQTKKEIPVTKLSPSDRELVAAFARKLDELPPDVIEKLKKAVFKTEDSAIPFNRKRRGLLVPPLSTVAIREFAETVRTAFVKDDQVRFPIMDVLEFRLEKFVAGFHLGVGSADEMGVEEGRVVADDNCVLLREDVYTRAWNNDGRARFTACHELAHFLMHRGVSLARVRADEHPIYQDSEWQADTFAGTLLMSNRHLPRFGDHYDAASQCGMTYMAAGVMWSKYEKEGLTAS